MKNRALKSILSLQRSNFKGYGRKEVFIRSWGGVKEKLLISVERLTNQNALKRNVSHFLANGSTILEKEKRKLGCFTSSQLNHEKASKKTK